MRRCGDRPHACHPGRGAARSAAPQTRDPGDRAVSLNPVSWVPDRARYARLSGMTGWVVWAHENHRSESLPPPIPLNPVRPARGLSSATDLARADGASGAVAPPEMRVEIVQNRLTRTRRRHHLQLSDDRRRLAEYLDSAPRNSTLPGVCLGVGTTLGCARFATAKGHVSLLQGFDNLSRRELRLTTIAPY
jgi:hypothetical protein